MTITLENMGILRYAEIELGKFTVICGMNNHGKTYATYALYGFLHFWNNEFEIDIDSNILAKLRITGICSINLETYANDCLSIVTKACEEYSSQLSSVFASQSSKFNNASFFVKVSADEIVISKNGYEAGVKSSNQKTGLTVSKKPNESELIVTLFSESSEIGEIPDFIITQAISHAIKNVVFKSVLPNVFIASAERTGAAIFRKELNFARNKILETLGKKDSDIDPLFLLRKGKSDYAWPVDHNVEFVRNLDSIARSTSYLSTLHSNVLSQFNDLLGGDYQVTDKDELFFKPNGKGNSSQRFTMDESSSSVRSLLDIGFYLKHKAEDGDLLMIDEPELNLHPNNQRKIARLLSSLVNCGIKVFITTHSDYILRELNNLILMNGSSPHLADLMNREGYLKTELAHASNIKIYNAGEGMVLLPGRQRKSSAITLTDVLVDDETGIHSSSFDDVIDKMNQIADDIIYGG